MKYTIIILSFFALFFVQKAAAQSLDVYGGIGFSGMRHIDHGERQESRMSTGYQLGVGLLLPLNKSYYKDKDGMEMTGVYPSLQFIKKGLRRNTLIDPIPSDFRLNYLQLTIPYYTRVGYFGIGVGPYAAVAMSGKTKYSSISGGDRSIKFGNGMADDLKRLDYGLSLSMGISLFYIQYDFGLANLGTGKYGSAKNRNFNVGLLIPLINAY